MFIKLKTKSISIVVVIFSLTMLCSCAQMQTGQSFLDSNYQLSSEPFSLKVNFPIPPGAKPYFPYTKYSTLEKIGFKSKKQISEILEFYDQRLTSVGLKEYPSHSQPPKQESRAYWGWPNKRSLTISVVDESKLSSKEDFRIILINLEHSTKSKVAN